MYRVGDELVIRIEEDFGYRDKTHRDVKVQVIGEGLDQWICYVPHYIMLPHAFVLNTSHQRWFSFENKYVGDKGIIVTIDTIVVRHTAAIPGSKCNRCHEFIMDAVPDEHNKFFCRACRENPYR